MPTVTVLDIFKQDGGRMVVSGVKQDDHRPKYGATGKFTRLGGGHGEYTTGSNLWVHIKGDSLDTHVDVAGQFRGKFEGRLTPKRTAAIESTKPSTLEVDIDGDHVRVSDASIDAWYENVLVAMKAKR